VNKVIIIASHKTTGADLPYPYYEMVRTDAYDLSINKHQVTSIDNLPGPTLPWSEYAQFFSSFPLSEEIEMYGLMQYRCAINFESEATSDVFSNKVEFFKRQVSYMDEYYDRVVVSNRLNFDCSLWDQYLTWHRRNAPLLVQACGQFFDITGNDAQRYLSTESSLYSRNIFLAPVDFAQRWHDVSLEIAKYLHATDNEHKTNDRWGGFILERLFSAFVHYETEYDVVEKPLIYFKDNY